MLVPEPPRTKTELKVIADKFTCPYCLYEASLSKFYMKLKSGLMSEKRFKCPDCNRVMNKQTLTRKLTVEEFAQWMLDSQAWERVSFDKFKTRLKEMGISYQFWTAYNKAKEEAMKVTDEEEEAYERYQEDWAKEKGLI